jgi:hypothetical protein
MSEFTNPLESIKIASPCAADWEEMIGDNQRRFCGACKLNVYNLSGMSRREAEKLILQSENRLCVRFYKRPDGSILTKDCPVGWQVIRRNISKTATALSGIGLANYFAESREQQTMGEKASKIKNTRISAIAIENANTGDQEKPVPMKGNIAAPSNREYSLSNGAMSNLEAVRTRITNNRRR